MSDIDITPTETRVAQEVVEVPQQRLLRVRGSLFMGRQAARPLAPQFQIVINQAIQARLTLEDAGRWVGNRLII